MNKRIISVLSLIVVFILVLSGCNSGENTENTTIETTTLSQDVNADVTSEAESKTETEVTTENKNETTKVKEHLTVTTAKQSVSTEKATKKPASSSLTAEDVVDIYFRNQNVWLPEVYMPMGGFRYIFLDLDFDGVLELVVNVNDGSGRYSTNTYFKINKSTKKIEEIRTDEFDKFEFGFDYGNEIKLVKNSATGKMRYYCIDFLRVSNQDYGSYYGVMWLENSKINTEILFCETFTAAGAYGNAEDVESFYYHVGEKSVEITKEDYDNRVNAFFAENKDLNLKFEAVDGYEFGDATPSQQKAMLLKGYKAFSYNK